MTRTAAALLFVICTLGNVARGEVIDSGPGGFSLTHEVTISASRSEVWRAAVEEVGLWWNSAHTISGDARKLRMDARPQGCFCESIGEHTGVVHLTVTFVNTNVLLRLTGGLGPLGLMGVNGNMTWEFFDADEGVRVVFSYAVGGYRPGGLEDVAAPVDAVVGDALLRLQAHVETGNADNAAAR